MSTPEDRGKIANELVDFLKEKLGNAGLNRFAELYRHAGTTTLLKRLQEETKINFEED